MSILEEVISRQIGEHLTALKWFVSNTGQLVTWASLQQTAQSGARVVTQAKGIYKPEYSEYALSVRQTLAGPYDDKEIIFRADGSWVYSYHQEDSDPSRRDSHATNRGLMACKRDSVPVGVLVQKKSKPGAQYLVVGLALVSEWRDGFFVLEGFSKAGVAHGRLERRGMLPTKEL